MVRDIAAKGLSGYALEILRERARLAIVDPVGETEVMRPLDYEQAWLNFIWAEGELAKRARPLPTTEMNADIGEALGIPWGRQKGMIRCPAHDDRGASLSWTRKPEGLLIHCFAGCDYWAIRGALGL